VLVHELGEVAHLLRSQAVQVIDCHLELSQGHFARSADGVHLEQRADGLVLSLQLLAQLLLRCLGLFLVKSPLRLFVSKIGQLVAANLFSAVLGLEEFFEEADLFVRDLELQEVLYSSLNFLSRHLVVLVGIVLLEEERHSQALSLNDGEQGLEDVFDVRLRLAFGFILAEPLEEEVL